MPELNAAPRNKSDEAVELIHHNLPHGSYTKIKRRLAEKGIKASIDQIKQVLSCERDDTFGVIEEAEKVLQEHFNFKIVFHSKRVNEYAQRQEKIYQSI